MPTSRELLAEERSMVTMSFGDHIEELRIRLILALVGLGVGVAVTLIPPLNLGRLVVRQMQEPAVKTLSDWSAEQTRELAAAAAAAGSHTTVATRIPVEAFVRAVRQVFPDLPAPSADRLEQRYVVLPLELNNSGVMNYVLGLSERSDSLVALGPMEPAVIFFRVCLVTGLVIASPWVFYQIWAFVAAGLYRHERAAVYKFMPYSLGLFLAGVFVCFFAIIPLTLRFLLEFNVWLGVRPLLRLSEWMSFATVLPLAFGFCFQTPLVMLFLSTIGIFTVADYRAKRRLAIVLITVVAAVLTPGPDVSSSLLLGVAMIVLYEMGIWLVGRSGRTALARRSQPA
jgi:sec-independent protein translocase protein TatC